jgi:hypothetical protein
MNFEERFDKLTERHEALAQSVELFVISSREYWSELRARSLETEAKIQANRESISELITASTALLHTAESHERRITGLEEGRA